MLMLIQARACAALRAHAPTDGDALRSVAEHGCRRRRRHRTRSVSLHRRSRTNRQPPRPLHAASWHLDACRAECDPVRDNRDAVADETELGPRPCVRIISAIAVASCTDAAAAACCLAQSAPQLRSLLEDEHGTRVRNGARNCDAVRAAHLALIALLLARLGGGVVGGGGGVGGSGCLCRGGRRLGGAGASVDRRRLLPKVGAQTALDVRRLR
eukprot:3584804-Pleurochrysis_carterae.AAC.3